MKCFVQVVTHYLVKWKALPYEDATWELQVCVLKQFNNGIPFYCRKMLMRRRLSNLRSSQPCHHGVNWMYVLISYLKSYHTISPCSL